MSSDLRPGCLANCSTWRRNSVLTLSPMTFEWPGGRWTEATVVSLVP
jgi:hypothetical protein